MNDTISTLGDIVRTHASQRGDRRALVAGDRSWTYAELYTDSCRAANALAAAGVGPGDRVAFLDRNVPEYFAFLYGTAMLNAATVSVNWRLAAPEMNWILDNAEAKVLLIGAEFLGHLAAMDLATVTTVVVVGDPGDSGYATWGEFCATASTSDPRVECGPDDTCYQLYTSGTTGLPKGVELTNRNMFAMLPVTADEWQMDAETVNLVAMPLFHIAGSGWAVAGMYFGAETILMREVDPVEILAAIGEHRVTNALFVPAVLQFLQAVPGAENADFSSMRQVVYGASPITSEVLIGAMNLLGCEFVQVYGLTETTGAVTVLQHADHDPGGPRAHLLRSAGRPWGDVEIRIVDADTGADLPEGEVGEIWIRSQQNMKGYWANLEATAAAFPEGVDANGLGWFRSGDAGYLSDGYVYIHDRVKDMIVSGGENIYPAEVENCLMSHPEITDVAVIGVPDDSWGESVLAIVVPAAGTDPSDDDIIAFARERIATYKCPRAVARIDALPRNPSGKILKTELREPYWAGRDRRVN